MTSILFGLLWCTAVGKKQEEEKVGGGEENKPIIAGTKIKTSYGDIYKKQL
jgi:hypothetical protein